MTTIYLTASQVAERVQVSVSWVYKHLLAPSRCRLTEGAAYQIPSKQAAVSCLAGADKSDIEIDPAVDPLPTRNETTTRSTKRLFARFGPHNERLEFQLE